MPFESNSTKDYSDNNNDGTAVGATWSSSAGYDGKGAYNFDGNDYINMGTGEDFNFNGDFTISAWFKTSAVSDIHMIASRAAVNYYLDDTERGYYLLLRDASGVDSVRFNVGGSVNNAEVTWNGGSDGLWHHAVGVKMTTCCMLMVI